MPPPWQVFDHRPVARGNADADRGRGRVHAEAGAPSGADAEDAGPGRRRGFFPLSGDDGIRWLVKPLLFIAALVPLALLVHTAVNDRLGANPIETVNRYTGDWTLRFLLITLAVTPLRRITGWQKLVRLRRMLGLFAFFYACLHFLSWIWLDQYFDLDAMFQDVLKRPFITLGFICFLLLVPLAVTSTNAMVRRLGGRAWQRLHRLVYLIGIGGVVHFLWLVKSDITEPLLYGVVLAFLLGFRLWDTRRQRVRPPPAQPDPAPLSRAGRAQK